MSYSLEETREAILLTCFEARRGKSAGGQTTNNKLDCEKIKGTGVLEREVVRRVGRLAYENAPDFVVGVPDGANWLAIEVGKAVNANVVLLEKSEGGKLKYRDLHSRKIAQLGFSGVVIEDVFNRFTNTRRVLELEELTQKVSAVVGVWDRGDDALRQPLDIPHIAVITEHIPDILPVEAELWKYGQNNEVT